MWIGINTEKGKRIPDEEAFGYAMDEIRKDENLFDEFVKGFNPRFYYGRGFNRGGYSFYNCNSC